MILSSFANRVGNGLFNPVAALYFTRVVHLTPAGVGLGLTLAGLIGLLAGVPAGRLADRRGPRTVMLVTLAVQTLSMLAFVVVRSWGAFTAVATLDLLALSANNAARGAVIARVGGEKPAAFRATLRSYVNLGVVFGTVGAGFAVQLDSRAAYTALVLANAASYVVCGLLLLRVPNYPPLPRPAEQPRFGALRDRPFVTFAALYGAMGLQYTVVGLVLPIWIAAHTHAPRWTVAAISAFNAAVCVLLQARLGRRVETPEQGGRAFRRAGLLFLVSCPLMALAAGVPSWAAIALLVVAIVLHSLGEIWESSAAFAVSFGLAPDHAQGQYQGLLGLGFDLGQAIGPALLTTLCLGLGGWGWCALGLAFAALGAGGPAVASWGARTRQGVLPQPVAA
ncbi:MFS transporter [Kitasatospora viridis]|uniref:MFS transporter n=1 Tax=Kitasatospora viridis TaxID=281105 RepID=A0A561S9P1_9ACTN|nr:MFS transporter [Kitasatospora viridis]TWF71525.1 MFS transporter [Kitasatospora viridis]